VNGRSERDEGCFPSHMPSTPQLLRRRASGLPVTSIAQIPGTATALVASGSSLVFLDLQPSTSQTRSQQQRWKVFERERVHRINIKVGERTGQFTAVVTGGREAVLIRICSGYVFLPNRSFIRRN
jgi:hypothetical protein